MALASSDSDDETLKAAIALSLAEHHSPQAASNDTLSSLVGSRKAMEQERLARHARKRHRSISPPARGSRQAPKMELEETTITLESGAKLRTFSANVQQDQQARKGDTANEAISRMKAASPPSNDDGVDQESLPSGVIRYPNGIVMKTWAFRHERTGHDVKLEEVLEASTLRTAVLSAFQWDVEWVLSKLNTPLNGGSTKCIFVMEAKEREYRDKLREDTSHMSAFLKLCLPPMYEPINCMHSKLMLLFHPNKLRVAIPSANLLNFDWGETGQMENSVFMIDLPRLPAGSKPSFDNLTFFGKELMLFIEKQGLAQDVRDGVLGFDFSATEGIAFIHTIGGVHYKETAERTGLLGLARAVKHLKQSADPKTLEIDFAASSIGRINAKYLQDIIVSASGRSLVTESVQAKARVTANFFKKGAQNSASGPNIQNIRIYFPTCETVQASTAGTVGSICLQRKTFEAKPFPRDCFRDYKSTRPGLLSHNKLLCARGKQGNRDIAWVYHGSSNVSRAAWGDLPTERTQAKITCRNWECGVLLPVQLPMKHAYGDATIEEDAETESEDETADEMIGMETFASRVDIPWVYPGEKYDGREPWYFTEKH